MRYIPVLLLIFFPACRQDNSRPSQETDFTPEEKEVRAVVEEFLSVLGIYDLDAAEAMMTTDANIGIAGLREGKWVTRHLTFTEYREAARQRETRPFLEPVREFTIHVTDNQLAFVKADAILHTFGVPRSNNIDYFTLIREGGVWRILSAAYTAKPLPAEQMLYDPQMFAQGYARSWCSQKPEYVSLFFSELGSLSVNDGTPAVGRTAIAEVAEGFMTAFPDMIVTLDTLKNTPDGTEFHWTLTGTNTGPGGTGNRVVISGLELWQLDDEGLIRESRGSFDVAEYQRQLQQGRGG